MSKVEMHFMGEGMRLWTSFTSPKWLNTEFPACTGDKLNDFSLILILVKTEGLDYLPPFSLQNTEDLGILSFPILLNTKGHYYDGEDYSLSNIDGFELDVALSLASSLASSVMMYYVSDYLSLLHLEIFTGWDGM